MYDIMSEYKNQKNLLQKNDNPTSIIGPKKPNLINIIIPRCRLAAINKAIF